MNDIRFLRDPRYLQITTLFALWMWAGINLNLEVFGLRPYVILGTCLLVQWIASKCVGIKFDPKSALISSLSLILLLRSPSLITWVVVAIIAIGSKFLLRFRGKHIWNPTNLGLAVGALCFSDVWMSPGSWGQTAIVLFFIVSLGSLILRGTARSDATWVVITLWITLLFGRAMYLGDPLSIPLHQLKNGSFWIFTFLMISDPKTLPDHRWMRRLYAALVTLLAFGWTFVAYEENGWIWALFCLAPLVPFLDWIAKAKKFEWPEVPNRWRLVTPTLGSLLDAAQNPNSASHARPMTRTIHASFSDQKGE